MTYPSHRITSLWVVCDPTPVSEIGDILFEASPNHLANYIVGTAMHSRDWESRRHTLYAAEAPAREDAEARLAKRDGKVTT